MKGLAEILKELEAGQISADSAEERILELMKEKPERVKKSYCINCNDELPQYRVGFCTDTCRADFLVNNPDLT
jgi:uncharacterized protein with PIN domain